MDGVPGLLKGDYMIITLYNNASEKNKIGKNLSVVETLMGNLKEQSSITHPVITIERASPIGFNYCYIDEFSRFYFVDDVVMLTNNIMRVSLSVDVLESFKNQILNQNVIIDKNTFDVNKYLPDENWMVNVKTKTDIVNFPSGLLESGEFILITAGG